eukprot:2738126-Pleurochrysis_carterae.AAC.1
MKRERGGERGEVREQRKVGLRSAAIVRCEEWENKCECNVQTLLAREGRRCWERRMKSITGWHVEKRVKSSSRKTRQSRE